MKRFEVVTRIDGDTPIVDVYDAAKCNIMASGVLIMADFGGNVLKAYGPGAWLTMEPKGEVEPGREIARAN